MTDGKIELLNSVLSQHDLSAEGVALVRRVHNEFSKPKGERDLETINRMLLKVDDPSVINAVSEYLSNLSSFEDQTNTKWSTGSLPNTPSRN